MRLRNSQQGLGMISAIVVLVILASLAGAMMTFGTAQQLTTAQDVMSVKAWHAAKLGNEWGLYMALNAGTGWDGSTACVPSGTVGTPGTEQTRSIDLVAELGFTVTVTCSATQFNEGEHPVTLAPNRIVLYTIASTAHNGGVSVMSPGYVERRRVVIGTD